MAGSEKSGKSKELAALNASRQALIHTIASIRQRPATDFTSSKAAEAAALGPQVYQLAQEASMLLVDPENENSRVWSGRVGRVFMGQFLEEARLAEQAGVPAETIGIHIRAAVAVPEEIGTQAGNIVVVEFRNPQDETAEPIVFVGFGGEFSYPADSNSYALRLSEETQQWIREKTGNSTGLALNPAELDDSTFLVVNDFVQVMCNGLAYPPEPDEQGVDYEDRFISWKEEVAQRNARQAFADYTFGILEERQAVWEIEEQRAAEQQAALALEQSQAASPQETAVAIGRTEYPSLSNARIEEIAAEALIGVSVSGDMRKRFGMIAQVLGRDDAEALRVSGTIATSKIVRVGNDRHLVATKITGVKQVQATSLPKRGAEVVSRDKAIAVTLDPTVIETRGKNVVGPANDIEQGQLILTLATFVGAGFPESAIRELFRLFSQYRFIREKKNSSSSIKLSGTKEDSQTRTHTPTPTTEATPVAGKHEASADAAEKPSTAVIRLITFLKGETLGQKLEHLARVYGKRALGVNASEISDYTEGYPELLTRYIPEEVARDILLNGISETALLELVGQVRERFIQEADQAQTYAEEITDAIMADAQHARNPWEQIFAFIQRPLYLFIWDALEARGVTQVDQRKQRVQRITTGTIVTVYPTYHSYPTVFAQNWTSRYADGRIEGEYREFLTPLRRNEPDADTLLRIFDDPDAFAKLRRGETVLITLDDGSTKEYTRQEVDKHMAKYMMPDHQIIRGMMIDLMHLGLLSAKFEQGELRETINVGLRFVAGRMEYEQLVALFAPLTTDELAGSNPNQAIAIRIKKAVDEIATDRDLLRKLRQELNTNNAAEIEGGIKATSKALEIQDL